MPCFSLGRRGRVLVGDQDASVQIYEYQPTMYHCKVMIVDDVWVSLDELR